MLWSSGEKALLRKAAAIPLRLIYDSIPHEHLALFLPYVVISTGRSNHPHTCYLLKPEDLNLEKDKEKIWPSKFVDENAAFIDKSTKDGRPYMSGNEKARIYTEIEVHSGPLTAGEGPIHIEIYEKTYGQLKSSSDLEYKGVNHLYPMAIFCKQQNGSCFLVVSADYTRSPYGDFKAVRWKEQLKVISSVEFWKLFSPDLCDVDVTQWRKLRTDAVSILRPLNFAAHHMLGGLDISGDSLYDAASVIGKLTEKDSWLDFIQKYDYRDLVDGAIRDWKKPPIRAILETAENDLGSMDLENIFNRYSENPENHTNKVRVINNINNKYGYMWFNATALLKGIQLFVENSGADAKIQISLNIGNTDTFKGAVIQIYQLSDNLHPNHINNASRYQYNEYFPYPKGENKTRTLGNAFRYFFYAGVKYVVYRAFDSNSNQYLQSIIQLISETAFEKRKNLPSNGMVDATLCLLIPAEVKVDYSYRSEYDVWLVADKYEIDINELIRRISL